MRYRKWVSFAPFGVALATSLLCPACKPERPTLTVTSTALVGATTTGLALRIGLSASNPNPVDLTVRAVTAVVSTAGRPLVNVTLPQSVRLLSQKNTPFFADAVLPWPAVEQLARLTVAQGAVSYHVSGAATVGTTLFSLEVPFEQTGAMTLLELRTHLPAGFSINF